MERNACYQGDCLEIMKQIEAGSIDMILTDLPYGSTKNPWDIIIPFVPLWEQYKRIIKPNGAIVLTASQPFTSELVMSNRKMFRYDLTWDKVLTSGFLNANRMPLRSHEDILVFYSKQPTYNPQKTQGVKCHTKGTLNKMANNNYGDFAPVDNMDLLGDMKHPKSIVTFQKPHPSKAIHSTQKPVELFEYLIRTYTNEGDIVLDSCAGSGTAGEAANNTGRAFILIEQEEVHCDLIAERVGCKIIRPTIL